MSVAKLFTHGGSQAVRLPKEFRFEGTEVHVRRVGDEVVLSARPVADWSAIETALEAFEPGMPLQRDQPPAQERAPIRPVRPISRTRPARPTQPKAR
jgi:antitoxin VapB